MCISLSAKILVVGGCPKSVPLEIIDLINPKLQSDIVVDENGSRAEVTGGILQNQPLICGGYLGHGSSTTNVSVIGMPNLALK